MIPKWNNAKVILVAKEKEKEAESIKIKSFFGLLKRCGKLYVKMINNTAKGAQSENMYIIYYYSRKAKLDSIVYSDSYRYYDILDVSEFKH